LRNSGDEHGRQPAPDKGTAAQAKPVKPVGAEQRAEPSPVSDEGKSNASGALWEQVWSKQNVLAALKRVESNGEQRGSTG